MDISEQYDYLTAKIDDNLPLIAFPTRELVQIFRKNGHPITLKTELTITSVQNSGDISGIMCAVELIDGYKMACALTHLIFSKTNNLYSEITNYQIKREKRLKQLRLTGFN
ncbi:MAG: hypothetical protein N4A49_05000 [Marinifilaceae bacterium]|jgi:hypothetical protein|nr:hypothetical protein [Marinifilaceae bacterium]